MTTVTTVTDGMKVRVVAGDRDTVLFDPFGVVRNIDLARDTCDIVLGYGRGPVMFRERPSRIGVGQDVVPHDWQDQMGHR